MSKSDLENMVVAGSVKDKAQLVDALGALYLAPDRDASPRERDLIFDILRQMIQDVEMRVRKKLAAQLADKTDAPHDLIVALANDVIEVALPVLENSPVLQDEDLIEVVLQRTVNYRTAVAGRRTVQEIVSQSIVSTGDVSAISTLLKNEGAKLGAETLDRLVDASAAENDYQELLISRQDLPESLANRLYEQVSDVLHGYLVETFPGLGDELDIAVSDAVERALEEDRQAVSPDFSTLEIEDSQIPFALVHALETDDILQFEDLFQRITSLSAPQAARAMYDLGMEGLAVNAGVKVHHWPA